MSRYTWLRPGVHVPTGEGVAEIVEEDKEAKEKERLRKAGSGPLIIPFKDPSI
jgi:hypothetical protein